MNQYIGKSRGGNTTKIHAVVAALGNPIHFELSGDQVCDNTAAIGLLANIDIKNAKESRDCDWWLYKERHLVVCFLNKIKHFQHVMTSWLLHLVALFTLLASGFCQNDWYFDFSDTP